MSLTWKLVFGFLFALVLQVAQMLISGHFTAQLSEASETVSTAMQANIASGRAADAIRELQRRIQWETEASRDPDIGVYRVYFEELEAQASILAEVVRPTATPAASAIDEAIFAVDENLGDLQAARLSSEADAIPDAMAFLDDALTDAAEALSRAEVGLRLISETGVALERSVRGRPLRAGVAIVFAGILVMAVFVAWFSRQLVIPIERAHAELESRVEERTSELASTVAALESEIIERKQAQSQREAMHKQLLDASRQAGMAELANGVLHNVGNILNSVNVSVEVLGDSLRQSKLPGLHRVTQLLREHSDDLVTFFQELPQGAQLPNYLDQLGRHLVTERERLITDVRELSTSVDHMKEIVHRQQAYARIGGAAVATRVSDLLDDVVRMQELSLARHGVDVEREIEWDEEVLVDRSRVVQILMNLIKNGKQAIRSAGHEKGSITVSVGRTDDRTMRIAVVDNGVGISAEGLTQIFAHGYTTKSEGHGFGLHHSANSAREMGGRLWAESAGVGCGARFVLELPIERSAALCEEVLT